VCWTVFTELLPGNALINFVTIYKYSVLSGKKDCVVETIVYLQCNILKAKISTLKMEVTG
jgi:hypothetical protein